MVARIGSGSPLLLLGAWCYGRPRLVCPAVGGGVGPYLDPAPRWDVFRLVGGVIDSWSPRRRAKRGQDLPGGWWVIEELADPAVFGGQGRERAAVVLGDGAWGLGAVIGEVHVRR